MVTHLSYWWHIHPTGHISILLVTHPSPWSHIYPTGHKPIRLVTLPSYWPHTHPTGNTPILLVTNPSCWSHTHPNCHTPTAWSHQRYYNNEICHWVLLPLPQWVGAPPGRLGVILLWSTCQVDRNNDCKQHNHIEFCVRAGWSNNPENVPDLSSFIFCSFVER